MIKKLFILLSLLSILSVPVNGGASNTNSYTVETLTTFTATTYHIYSESDEYITARFNLIDFIPDWCFILLFPFIMFICFLFTIIWIMYRCCKVIYSKHTVNNL